MKKLKSLLLLFLCGIFFFLCALGSTSTSNENYKRDAQENTNTKIIEVSFAEEKVYEGNNVVIYVTGSESSYDGTKINFRIENNSQLNLNFNAHSYGVNGIMTGNNDTGSMNDLIEIQSSNSLYTPLNNSLAVPNYNAHAQIMSLGLSVHLHKDEQHRIYTKESRSRKTDGLPDM